MTVDAVEKLVARFTELRADYREPTYNETQTRREFVDPLFEALGWDITNEAGLTSALKDVVHEDHVQVGEARREPDYCFRVGGERQFFVEAKKPGVNIAENASPAFQLRRYAWSAKLPLSILTDFEEFAVYDCRIEPTLSDDAAVARLIYMTYSEYVERWDDIASLFSRDSVVDGSIERYKKSLQVRRGTTEVDGAFLRELESWRKALAEDLAHNNAGIKARELNFAVQQTIDRIVFLRIAEDRGFEPYGQLEELASNSQVYKGLFRLFRTADTRYNSGLFHFEQEPGRSEAPDALTPSLAVSDAILKRIMARLYYPRSPYAFSVISTRVLGQVYEQFLGQIISLTDNHKARVEAKPEVKKAGGVYYTPEPIVDFIVRATVAPLLEGQTPRQASGATARSSPIRILDPACGSGSFLLGTYEYLLSWYLEAYVASGPEKWSTGKGPRIRQTTDGSWRLTIEERKRILLTHVYGVDIDPQAVEVTKLSLLLKVLEGETEALFHQLRLHEDRALPDLAQNIKCGNSLVSTDAYVDEQFRIFDEDTRTRINAFSWEDEYPEVFTTTGGFDAVIGNPPYIDSELMSEYMPEARSYCTLHYRAASGNWDIFCPFIERALGLCRLGGRQSFIVPNKLASAEYAKAVRETLAERVRLAQVRDYSSVKVFPVSVYPIIYVAEKEQQAGGRQVLLETMEEDGGLVRVAATQSLDRAQYFHGEAPWSIFGQVDGASPAERMSKEFQRLKDVADVWGGATVSEAYELPALLQDRRPTKGDVKVINSGTIDRYVSTWGKKPMRYLGQSYSRPIVPVGDQPRLPETRLEQAHTPKLVFAGMTTHLECAPDLAGEILAAKSTTIVISDLDLGYLLGILNSRLVDYWFANEYGGNRLQGGYLRVGPPQIREIPVPRLSSTKDQADRDRLADEVGVMLDLQSKLLDARTPHEQTALERQITAQEAQMEEIVNRLYRVTSTEAAAVTRYVESAPPPSSTRRRRRTPKT